MEKNILDLIQTLKTPLLDKLMVAISILGNGGLIFIIIGIIFLINKKHRRTGIHILITLIFCLIFGNLLLKPLIHRIRPYDMYNIPIIIKPLKDYSFPSGHTYASFGTAFSILMHKKKIGYLFLIFATLMAFSRMYLYVHYPTDILGGIILGLICATISKKIIEKNTDYNI